MKDKDINPFKVEDRPVILTHIGKKKVKAVCLVCPDTELLILNYNEETKSDFVMSCPKCKRKYFPSSEIMEFDDVLTGPHDDNINIELEGISALHKPVVFFADDDNLLSDQNDEDEDDNKKGGFYSMDYLKGLGKTIVDVKEDNNN